MVFPNEGEWWGHFADGDLTTVRATAAHAQSTRAPAITRHILTIQPISMQVLPMKETKWYKDDVFGLKTVDQVTAELEASHVS